MAHIIVKPKVDWAPRRPSGPLRLNQLSPLARDLRAYWDFSYGYGRGRVIRNLVPRGARKDFQVDLATGTTPPVYEATRAGGFGVRVTGEDTTITPPEAARYAYAEPAAITVAIWFIPHDITGGSGGFKLLAEKAYGDHTTPEYSTWQFTIRQNDLIFQISTAGTNEAQAVLTDKLVAGDVNTPCLVVGDYSTSTGLDIYLNDRDSAAQGTPPTDALNYDTSATGHFFFGISAAQTGPLHDHTILSLALWGRVLHCRGIEAEGWVRQANYRHLWMRPPA